MEILNEELPWRCIEIHAEAVPFWVAEDVDGLEGLCHASDVPPPSCLISARPIFSQFGDTFPAMLERIRSDLTDDRRLGGYVPAADVPELLTFLTENGARIRALSIEVPSLESVFLTLTGREIRDKAAGGREQTLAFGKIGGEHTR